MLFDNTDFNYEISLFTVPGNDNFKMENKSGKFLCPEEGFLRGNLENNTFVPYKGYTYFKLKPENEKEKMLLKLMSYSFAINELNLYLDLHPEDMENYNLFHNYVREYDELEMAYVKKYGPLCVMQSNGDNFNWVKNPWPFDKQGGSMYV